MKTWMTYGSAEAQSGSAPAITVQQAAKSAADQRRASTPHVGSSATAVKLGMAPSK